MRTVLLSLALLAGGVLYPQKGLGRLQIPMDQLGQAYEKAGYHGVVLLAGKDGLLGSTAFGIADQLSGRANHLKTLFKTESTGKLFTATATMQLVEAGKLDLQKTVADYLPFSGLEKANKITLHHLLTHQSGLTSPWERASFEFREYDTDEWWSLITGNPRAFEEPGSGVYYSSSAYEVLGAIIEAVSGKRFERYCQEHLFAPAGMTDTHYRMDTLELARTGAKPYRWTGSRSFYQYPLRIFHAGGAGGWFSNLADFQRFATALIDGRLLQKASLDLMMTPHVAMPPGHYGYGMQILKDHLLPGKTLYGHNGGGMGYGADLFFEPESGIIVVCMMNMYGNSTEVSANFLKLAFGQAAALPKMHPQRLLFDQIETGGLEDFAAHYNAYIAAVGIGEMEQRSLLAIGESYSLMGRKQEEQRYYEILSGIMPENVMVWLLLGDLAQAGQEPGQARVYYEKALFLAEAQNSYWEQTLKQKLAGL